MSNTLVDALENLRQVANEVERHSDDFAEPQYLVDEINFLIRYLDSELAETVGPLP